MNTRDKSIIVIVAAIAIIVALALAPYVQHDKDICGTYYVSEISEATFYDSPSVITLKSTEEEGLKYTFMDRTADTVVMQDSKGENLTLALQNGCIYSIQATGDNPCLISGAVIDKDNIAISMLSCTGDLKAYSFVLTRLGAQPSAMPEAQGFHMDLDQTVTATSVANNVTGYDTDPGKYTLKYLGTQKRMVFYQTASPESEEPLNCLGIAYTDGSFMSTYSINGVCYTDFVYSEKGYINCSSASRSADEGVGIEVWSVDYVMDNRELVYPDLGGSVYTGTQRVYNDSTVPEFKNLTIMPEQHSKSIVTMNNSFGRDRSVWGAAIVPMSNGDYRLNIFAMFEENGISYRGLYTSCLSSDLKSFDIYCTAVSADGKTVISFGETEKKDTTDDGKVLIGKYTPVSGSIASYDSDMNPVIAETGAPSFEIVSVDNGVMSVEVGDMVFGGVYDGNGSFTLGTAFGTDVRCYYKDVGGFDEMTGTLTLNTFVYSDDGQWTVGSCTYTKDGYTPVNQDGQLEGPMLADESPSEDILPVIVGQDVQPTEPMPADEPADASQDSAEQKKLSKGDVYRSYAAYSLIDETYTDESSRYSYVYEVVDVIDGFYFIKNTYYTGNEIVGAYRFIAVEGQMGSYSAFCFNNGSPITDTVVFNGDVLYTGSSGMQDGKLATWAVCYTEDGSKPADEQPAPASSGTVFVGTDYDVFSDGRIFDSATKVTFRNQNGNMLRMDIQSGENTSDWTALMLGGIGNQFISASTFVYDGVTYHGTYKGTFSADLKDLRITGIAYGEDLTMVYIVFDLTPVE